MRCLYRWLLLLPIHLHFSLLEMTNDLTRGQSYLSLLIFLVFGQIGLFFSVASVMQIYLSSLLLGSSPPAP